MDLTQLILFFVLLAVAILLIVIGIQIISLLRDTKKSLERVDNLLNDLEFLVHNFTRSTSALSQISLGLKSGLELAGTISQLLRQTKSKKKRT